MIDYERDFYGWCCEQAALLRQGQLQELDVDHLVEELESLGRSEKRELASRLEVLLAHLLKWQYQSDYRGASWRDTLKEQRIRTREVIDDNPSLQPQLSENVEKAYRLARFAAKKQTKLPLATFPDSCPYSAEQILDDDFFPDTPPTPSPCG